MVLNIYGWISLVWYVWITIKEWKNALVHVERMTWLMGCDGLRWVAMGCDGVAMGCDGVRWGAMGCDGVRWGAMGCVTDVRDGDGWDVARLRRDWLQLINQLMGYSSINNECDEYNLNISQLRCCKTWKMLEWVHDGCMMGAWWVHDGCACTSNWKKHYKKWCMRKAPNWNYVPRGCLRPPYAESSAVGRNAKFNEVIKRVIIVFKIIFFNGLCRRRVGNWGCSGLHVCVFVVVVVVACGKHLNESIFAIITQKYRKIES